MDLPRTDRSMRRKSWSLRTAASGAPTIPRSCSRLARLIAAGLLFAFYSRRKPIEGQTSYYQRMRLMKLRQKFSSKTTGMVFGFTNSAFATKLQP